MITQRPKEKRIEYLARVLYVLMNETDAGYATVDYDETTCDGICLAQDFLSELNIDEHSCLDAG
jgi:hypothetical protein